MSSDIFGVNPNAPITPLIVRDAIIVCFREAHCDDVSLDSKDEVVNHNYSKSIVAKAFKETGGDFENPTREDLVKCINYLAQFASNFREKEIIAKHHGEISNLISRL